MSVLPVSAISARDERAEAPLDAVGHLAQQRTALGGGGAAPRAAQRRARRLHGAIDERGVGLGDGAEHTAVDRAYVVEAGGARDGTDRPSGTAAALCRGVRSRTGSAAAEAPILETDTSKE